MLHLKQHCSKLSKERKLFHFSRHWINIWLRNMLIYKQFIYAFAHEFIMVFIYAVFAVALQKQHRRRSQILCMFYLLLDSIPAVSLSSVWETFFGGIFYLHNQNHWFGVFSLGPRNRALANAAVSKNSKYKIWPETHRFPCCGNSRGDKLSSFQFLFNSLLRFVRNDRPIVLQVWIFFIQDKYFCIGFKVFGLLLPLYSTINWYDS